MARVSRGTSEQWPFGGDARPPRVARRARGDLAQRLERARYRSPTLHGKPEQAQPLDGPPCRFAARRLADDELGTTTQQRRGALGDDGRRTESARDNEIVGAAMFGVAAHVLRSPLDDAHAAIEVEVDDGTAQELGAPVLGFDQTPPARGPRARQHQTGNASARTEVGGAVGRCDVEPERRRVLHHVARRGARAQEAEPLRVGENASQALVVRRRRLRRLPRGR